MGESMVEAHNIESKMRESVASRETLGVSVSFGKYENDSLSWEKWSTFSPNKYLDEVGKCSTPGSVAQKKAFFEAHYKKIAAMKAEAEAELLDRKKATEPGASRSDDHTEDNFEEIKEEHEEIIEIKACVNDEEPKVEISTIKGSEKNPEEVTSVKDEILLDESLIASNNNVDNLEDAISVKGETFQDESFTALNNNGGNLEVAISVKDESVQDESLIALNNNGGNLEGVIPVKEESSQNESLIALNNNKDNFGGAMSVKDESFRDESISKVYKINGEKLDEAVLVNNESMKLVKQHFKVDLEDPQESKQEILKPKAQKVGQKVNPTKVEKNLVMMKKKPTSLIPKSPEISSTKLSKPKATPSTTPMNATRSSSKKANATSSVSSKSIRTTPMSLHLSMSMNSVNSDTASSVTSSRRRSLFMEQMGDKDIVKRAFKTFQNRINELPVSDGRSSAPKQTPTKELGQKASTSMASQKENERSRKAGEKMNPTRGQLGSTWRSESSGKSLQGVSMDEKRIKGAIASSAVVLRSNERAQRRKEFFKNLEEKSNAREAERTQINTKSKEVKEAEMKKLRQNISFKAKPMPSFYKAQSKSTSEKEAIKNGTQRRPDTHR